MKVLALWLCLCVVTCTSIHAVAASDDRPIDSNDGNTNSDNGNNGITNSDNENTNSNNGNKEAMSPERLIKEAKRLQLIEEQEREAMLWKERLNQKERHLTSIPRVHIDDLAKTENIDYLLGRKPFILTGAMDDWAARDVWDEEFFSEFFDEEIVDFYPYNMIRAEVRPYLDTFVNAFHEMHVGPTGHYKGGHTEKPGMYMMWNMGWYNYEEMQTYMGDLPAFFRWDLEWIKTCLPNKRVRNEFFKKTHWRMLLIGNEGAGMFNHKDSLRMSTFQATVMGRKRWHLCTVSEDQFMYGAGDVDAFNPDYDRFPLFKQARCMDDVAVAGEILFYPRDTWHQTINLDPWTVGIAGTKVDGNNYDTLTTALQEECAYHRYNYDFSEELCSYLPKCYRMWRDRFTE